MLKRESKGMETGRKGGDKGVERKYKEKREKGKRFVEKGAETERK